MDWDDIKLLVDRGHSIGSHTMSHRSLVELTNNEILEEIMSEITVPMEAT